MDNFIDTTYKRIEQIINYRNLNISSFEATIKVSNNSIGTAIRRKSSFKSNVLNKILNCFPEINPTWLLTGKGQMFLDENVSEEPNDIYKTSIFNRQVKIRVLDLLLKDEEIKTALLSHLKTATNEQT